jgi:hypothetical protein
MACHMSAIQGGTVAMASLPFHRPAPVLARQSFASADAALSQKPPIS